MISIEKWRRLFGNKLSPRLAQEVFSASEREKVQVIMEFSAFRSCRSSKIKETILKAGGKIIYELPLINSLAVELPSNELLKIIPAVKVRMVWPDVMARPCLDVAVPATGADRAHQEGITGKKVVVAVIDTGIDFHADLTQPEPRIIGWYDLVNNKPEPYDDEGHGTHIAGIIAGNGYESDGLYTGIAPEALLVGVKVLDSNGSGPISRVIAGIQWVVENKDLYGIKAINLSLGASAEEGYKTDPASKAVEAAWKAGLVVLVAAGNSGPAQKTITTPGIAPSVITVGSINDQRTIPRTDDIINDFSSRGPTIDRLAKPDLLAPGAKITSLKPETGYTTHSGTSMATPMVTGAVALLLEKNPKLTPKQIKHILISTAEDRGYSKFIQGAGYLNIAEALGFSVQEPQVKTNIAPEELTLTILMILGLNYAQGEAKTEVLSILANQLGAWFQKSSQSITAEEQSSRSYLPNFLKTLGERMF